MTRIQGNSPSHPPPPAPPTHSPRQVERMIRTLKRGAFSDGTLDADRFQRLLGKELKLEPSRQIYLVTHHGDAKPTGKAAEGKAAGQPERPDLQIPTRLALHRRHVILAALRSHSVVEDEGPLEPGGEGWTKEKELLGD